MIEDIQNQKPWTVNQNKTERPNAPRTKSVLSGAIGGSMNGGHNKVIAWKKVMAGEKHYQYTLNMNMQMLTPLTPAYQKLKCTIRTYFVPNSRIWKNAEKYTAQKGGTAEIKITEIPNLAGKTIPGVWNAQEGVFINPTSTNFWREAFISSYLPRMGTLQPSDDPNMVGIELPSISVLPLRGRVAIYNDFERNKEYQDEEKEYNDDTVSNEEWYSYLPNKIEKAAFRAMRAKREDNYYTNYRTEIQGFEESFPPNFSADESLVKWAAYESKISEARAEASNAQKNDWQIIAEIRGSKMLSEGKVQLIGKNTFDLNYSAITQNAYNTSTQIQPEFRVMGKQGAYSYTNVQIPLYAAMEFKEEGYIHVIATVSADTVFETGIDRNLLNNKPLDEYRPDMEGDKFDVLYEIETGSRQTNQLIQMAEDIVGFKRKYSEYFKLPNVIQADMTTQDYYELEETQDLQVETEGDKIITNKTYQFFEEDRRYDEIEGYEKRPWLDYTDLMINKNQAIKNEIKDFGDDDKWLTVAGQNQIFFVGVCNLIVDLPINEEVKNSYQTWGEH